MKTDAYLITCLTNLHVGSGESNYGVVDNLVQRDPITNIPVIHSSSLKGALREYFKDRIDKVKLNYIFGPDSQRDSTSDSGIGHYKFFEANMIVLPVRSNVKPFYRATSKFLLEDIKEKADAFNIEFNLPIIPFTNNAPSVSTASILEPETGCILEDWDAIGNLNIENGNNYIGENPALFHTDSFKELANHLPVIARNQLENGESKNLWYEEVVPRESRFVFFVTTDGNYEKDFEDKLNGKVVQIGGNASIGYGYCKVEKISEEKSNKNENAIVE